MTYQWRVGDRFRKGPSVWVVDSVRGDKAVLRSEASSWATTIPLTWDEWNKDGGWELVPR